MKYKKFIFVNLLATLLEYIVIFLVCFVFSKENLQLSLLITGSIFVFSVLLTILILNVKTLKETDDTDAKLNDTFKKLLPIIEKAEKEFDTTIKYGVVTEPNLYTSAFALRNKVYINLAYPVKPIYAEGVIAHEIGHLLSGFLKIVPIAQLRITTYFSSALKYLGGYLRRSKNILVKLVRYLVFVLYVGVNTMNYFVLFPFMKREEHVANAYACKLGYGDSLRCHYYSMIAKGDFGLDLFDQVHPKVRDMIELINQVMGYTKDYELDIYGVNNNIYYITNSEDEQIKDTKVFNWYLSIADTNDKNVQNKLGFMYYHGKGTSKDLRKAVTWYNKAVKSGLTKLYYNIGLCYEELGRIELAIHNFKEATEAGVIKAYNDLGRLQELHEETLYEAFESYYQGSLRGLKISKSKLVCKVPNS